VDKESNIVMNFENTIIIECPLEEAFAFVADFENVPKWNYFVKNVRKLSGGAGEGTIFHQIRQSDQQDFQVTDYRPNEAIAVETTPGSQPQFERRFVFESVDGGTQIVDSWKLDLGRHPLIQRLGAPRVKAAVSANLGKLKELLETGQPHLQDGREITR
jgi:uncharacterized membrane protein